MAPSSGHLLVPKAMRMVKFAVSKTTAIIRSKLPQTSQTTTTTNASLQPIRVYAQNQPLHPLAYLKKSRSSHNSRWFSSTAATRNFTSSAKPYTPRNNRSTFPVSKVSKAVSQRGAAPFASTLRPNLTGGTLPRSAGGYSLGGAGKGIRHFSHTPSAQAQVMQNVNAGIRAFFVGGGKARFDGMDAVTGEKKFRSISKTEDSAYAAWESPVSAASMRGTSLEFRLTPTVTALSPSFSTGLSPQDFYVSKADTFNLNSLDLLDNLAVDFARALKDLSAVLADLRRLSAFGDLPVCFTTTSGPILSVRFPGCDADLVSALCDEVGVSRGVIVEDEAWTNNEKDVEMAMLFPFAPSNSPAIVSEDTGLADYFTPKRAVRREVVDWENMLSPSTYMPSRAEPLHEHTSFDEMVTPRSPVRSLNSPSGYESLRDSDFASDDPYYPTTSPLRAPTHSTPVANVSDYEGLEGIYKFLQVCDESRR